MIYTQIDEKEITLCIRRDSAPSEPLFSEESITKTTFKSIVEKEMRRQSGTRFITYVENILNIGRVNADVFQQDALLVSSVQDLCTQYKKIAKYKSIEDYSYQMINQALYLSIYLLTQMYGQQDCTKSRIIYLQSRRIRMGFICSWRTDVYTCANNTHKNDRIRAGHGKKARCYIHCVMHGRIYRALCMVFPSVLANIIQEY